jgi:hypothetical protein
MCGVYLLAVKKQVRNIDLLTLGGGFDFSAFAALALGKLSQSIDSG